MASDLPTPSRARRGISGSSDCFWLPYWLAYHVPIAPLRGLRTFTELTGCDSVQMTVRTKMLIFVGGIYHPHGRPHLLSKRVTFGIMESAAKGVRGGK